MGLWSNTSQVCPADCLKCSAAIRGQASGESDAEGPPDGASRDRAPLAGGRLVLAAACVFVLPLAVMAAALVMGSDRLGEPVALALGVAAAAALSAPTWWFLRRGAESQMAVQAADDEPGRAAVTEETTS